jgi:DNA (cytosine-5)-methyltransferase 3A
MIKLLIGGSPCTHWSIAQRNRETTAEGEGWELFRNYLIAREKFQPDFFLYENNKSAAEAVKRQIGEELGAPLKYINSALVSAQRRERFYVHNFGDVPQPEDRGILLQDVLETGTSWVDKSYALTTRCCGAIPEDTLKRKRHTMAAESAIYNRPHGFNDGSIDHEKAATLTAAGRYECNHSVLEPFAIREQANTLRASAGEKQGQCNLLRYITSGGRYGYMGVPCRVGAMPTEAGELKEAQAQRIYSPDGKSVTLRATDGGGGAQTGLYAMRSVPGAAATVYRVEAGQIEIKGKHYPIRLPDGDYIIRKLTVAECCRLQTLPDDYCRAVSDTQAYKGLGNGWTAEVIIHILRHGLEGVDRDEEIVVLSMYDGIGTGRYCLEKLGFRNISYHAYEIDKFAITVARSNFPDISHYGDAFAVRADDWQAPGMLEGYTAAGAVK